MRFIVRIPDFVFFQLEKIEKRVPVNVWGSLLDPISVLHNYITTTFFGKMPASDLKRSVPLWL